MKQMVKQMVLNPLRAGMVERLETWPWSSYLATCGQTAAPEWLQTDWILAQFGGQRANAIRNYIQFVHEGARLPSVWTQLQGQIFLGSEAFVKKMQAQIDKAPTLDEIPRIQRRALTQPLADFEQRYARNEAMARAYLSGQHTMAAIAGHFGVHYATVSRRVRRIEESAMKDEQRKQVDEGPSGRLGSVLNFVCKAVRFHYLLPDFTPRVW